MRDPDVVGRAQLAASALECAWDRWRVVHSLTADPMPAVSSYVGYSLEEPWGQPRVVFGLAAEDAEQLAALLEWHDCVGPVHAAVTTTPAGRDLPARNGARTVPLPVPRQAPPAAAGEPAPDDSPAVPALADPLLAEGSWVPGPSAAQPWRDLAESGWSSWANQNSDDDEPVYRQAAAAMKEAVAARDSARQAEAKPDGTDSGDGQPAPAPGSEDVRGSLASGPLSLAASAARAEAEARIKAAALTGHEDGSEDGSEDGGLAEPDEPSEVLASDADEGEGAGDEGAGDEEAGAGASAEVGQPGDLDDDQVAAFADDDHADLPDGETEGEERDDDRDFGPEPAGPGPGWYGGQAEALENGHLVAPGDFHGSLPQIYATDVLEPLPSLDTVIGACAPISDVTPDGPDRGDQDEPVSGQPEDGASGVARRGRLSRGYQIPRLSRTKRPGAASEPAGS
jgi:hypothetical protein